MGVLACDRRDCENVMCDYFSYDLQMYICDDCKNEFINHCTHYDIELFMNSSKTGKVPHDDSAINIRKSILDKYFSNY